MVRSLSTKSRVQADALFALSGTPAKRPREKVSNSTIHIDELLDSNPIGSLQWRVVVLCFVLAVIDGFDAQIIAYVAPLLIEQFALSPAVMGQLYSSALFGLMAGALIGSPVADRIGRKPVIILSAAVMGLFALLTATAGSTFELFLYRFLTGLGLGGVMPTINILTAEFAPARRRALLMTTMFVGFPIGIMAGGGRGRCPNQRLRLGVGVRDGRRPAAPDGAGC